MSGVVQKTVEELLGTVVPNDAPLMGAGLDSLSAVDLVQTLGQRLGTELEPTALFDYPTIGSLTKYLDEQMEPATTQEAGLSDEYSSDEVTNEASKSLYDLYSELN